MLRAVNPKSLPLIKLKMTSNLLAHLSTSLRHSAHTHTVLTRPRLAKHRRCHVPPSNPAVSGAAYLALTAASAQYHAMRRIFTWRRSSVHHGARHKAAHNMLLRLADTRTPFPGCAVPRRLLSLKAESDDKLPRTFFDSPVAAHSRTQLQSWIRGRELRALVKTLFPNSRCALELRFGCSQTEAVSTYGKNQRGRHHLQRYRLSRVWAVSPSRASVACAKAPPGA